MQGTNIFQALGLGLYEVIILIPKLLNGQLNSDLSLLSEVVDVKGSLMASNSDVDYFGSLS